MRTFQAGLLVAATEAVSLKGAYEHDHYNQVPFTVAHYETVVGTHLEPVYDEITYDIRHERAFFHEHSDGTGFGDEESDSTVQTIISFRS